MACDKKQTLMDLAEKLSKADPSRIQAVIGFDGFVDEIVHVVDKRLDVEHYERLESMAAFGERIRRSAGLSTNVEMVTVQQKLGGNGPIFANALIHYGMDLTYIGALGAQGIHPVFKDMVSRCRPYAISDPAQTDAIEFFDGKIISSKLAAFNQVNWQSILQNVGLEKFVSMLDDSLLVGFENWTMLPYMSQILKSILKEAAPLLNPREHKAVLFFDLADPEKRKKEDIEEALSLISKFNHYFEVYIGLNRKEACEIAEVLGMQVDDYDSMGLKALAEFIYSKMDVRCVMIHPVKEACAISKEGFAHVEGPFCAKPRLTTGAGDNMNAGFILGITLGFTTEEALLLGTATSGYYVRNAKSPDIPEMVSFLKAWAAGELDQNS